jgi:hypothetical protein
MHANDLASLWIVLWKPRWAWSVFAGGNSYLNATIGLTFVVQRAGMYYGEESWILAQATLREFHVSPKSLEQPSDSHVRVTFSAPSGIRRGH